MAEKGELPNDQVSLPPTYAPSESFTESPPPAYRKPGTAAVKVARIVCITLFCITFLIGFFIVAHRYVDSHKQCNCPEATFGESSPLVAEASFGKFDLNNNKIEDAVQEIEEQAAEQGQVADAKEAEEEQMQNNIDVIENQMMQEEKNIKLPIDMLLGNPALAGRDVKCKVQKRQQKIADGIMSQAIIVTCDDDGESEIPAMGMRPPTPPLSLLSKIMKVLASRARPLPSEESEPKIQIKSIPIYGPQGETIPMNLQGPFPIHMKGPMPVFKGPMPFSMKEQMPFPMNEQMPFPMNERMPFPMNEQMSFPMNEQMSFPMNEQMPFPMNEPMPFRMKEPIHFHPQGPLPIHMNGPPMPEPAPMGRMIRNFQHNEINEEPQRPEPYIEESENSMPIIFPQRGPMAHMRPIKVIRGHPIQINEQEQEFPPPPPIIMRSPEESMPHEHLPFPFSDRPMKIVRIIRRGNDIEEVEKHPMNHEEEHEGPFPFPPLHPIMKLLPRRSRLLRVIPKPMEEEHEMPQPMQGSLPLARGALPAEPFDDEHQFPESLPISMPEAKARALPQPMELPGLRLIRIPISSMPEMEISTHMEMKEQHPQEEEPIIFPPQNVNPDEDFGPPRTHTVIEAAPEPPMPNPEDFLPSDIFPPSDDTFYDESVINQPHPQPDFIEAPPPTMDREGRFSPVAEINPDAEPIHEEPMVPREEYAPINPHHIIVN